MKTWYLSRPFIKGACYSLSMLYNNYRWSNCDIYWKAHTMGFRVTRLIKNKSI